MEKKNAHTSCENVSAQTAPSYPNPESQAGILLAALLTGKRIDPLTGWVSLGIYRLSDTVLRLRRIGWPIQNIGLTVKNCFGHDCDVALYMLPNESIIVSGWIGEAFANWASAQAKRNRKPR